MTKKCILPGMPSKSFGRFASVVVAAKATSACVRNYCVGINFLRDSNLKAVFLNDLEKLRIPCPVKRPNYDCLNRGFLFPPITPTHNPLYKLHGGAGPLCAERLP
jgi:hypothetical protein